MMNKAIATAALGLIGLIGSTAAAEQVSAEAPTAHTCRDSNGSARGGSVYGYYDRALGCDVVSPQRLHIMRTPSLRACQDMGGHGWSKTRPTCWDVDH